MEYGLEVKLVRDRSQLANGDCMWDVFCEYLSNFIAMFEMLNFSEGTKSCVKILHFSLKLKFSSSVKWQFYMIYAYWCDTGRQQF